MTPAILIAILFCVLMGSALFIISRRELPDPLPVEDCGVCSRPITADRCRLVQVRSDELGEYAVEAAFHPDCCPIDAPDHQHAGTTVRVSSEP